MKTSDLRHRQDVPVITADQRGYITSINAQFEANYGWSEGDLLGKPLPTIIPPRFHDAHHSGFARFLATGKPSILGRSLELHVLTKDGREVPAEHFIVASPSSSGWEFAAIIGPPA